MMARPGQLSSALVLGGLWLAWGCALPEDKAGPQIDPGSVIASVVLSPAAITIPAGTTINFVFYATTVDGDSLRPTLDWVATGGVLGPDGEFTGSTPGTFRVIGVTHQAPQVGDTATVTVTALVSVDSVVVTPGLITLQPGAGQTFTATAYRSNGTTAAAAADWSATGGTINAAGAYTAGVTNGTFRVDATDPGTQQLLDTARVVIAAAPATLQAVEVTPPTGAVATGGTIQFTALGRYSDGSLLSLTVLWSAASGSITAGGLYTASQATGTFQVIGRHSASGFADTAMVTMTGILASLEITPPTVAMNFGGKQQFTVVGRRTDSSTTPVTVTWSGTGGTITASGFYTAGQAAGTYRAIARETATGIADTAPLTIQAPPPTVTDLDLLPSTASLLTGGTKQFTAQDVYSNGTTSATTNVSYLASAGTITVGGLYTAPASAGTFMVIATSTAHGFQDTTMVAVSAPATLTALVVAPSSATVGVGGVVPFVATGTLSNGQTTTVNATWSVNGGGTINSSGTFTAGAVPGQYQVIGRVTGGTLADSADVFVSAAPPTTSNEPAGYVPFAIHRLNEIPVYGRAVGGVLGSWYAYPQGNSLLSLQRDPNAPESPDSVISTKYPQGWVGGDSPVLWGGWDVLGSGTPGQKREWYLSLWVKVVGPDFENQAAGTKVGFIGVGRNINMAQNEAFFWLDNGSVQRFMSSFKILFKQQGTQQLNGNSARNMAQNVSTQPLMTAGVWHHWEAVMKLNTLGQANGIFKMWIDGVMTHNYSDVLYIWPNAENGFNLWKCGCVWGGTGGTKTRDDYIYIDHIYMSGLPL